MKATRAQIGKIWGASKEIGLERDDLYDLVARVSGSRSISELSFEHARIVIDRLVALGARAGTPKPHPSGKPREPGVTDMIRPDQLTMIEHLRQQLGGDWMRPEYFDGACKRVIKRAQPRTVAEGVRVIEMLKQRIKHEERKHRQE